MTQSLVNFDNNERYLVDIKTANFLPPVLLEKVQNLMPELVHNIQTQVIWRTETEIRCSVLNDMDFPDKASKFHQCKLEQMVFFEQLLQLSFEFRKLQQDLIIKEAEIEEIDYKLLMDDLKPFEIKKLQAEREKLEIERERMAYGIQHYQKEGKERIRELEVWSKMKEELDDGSFDKDNKDNNQLISLTRRYIIEAWNAENLRKSGGQGDISSYNNIIAQFRTLVRECIIRNKITEVLAHFGENSAITQWVMKEFGLVYVKPEGNEQ